jgi:hypothetical protein
MEKNEGGKSTQLRARNVGGSSERGAIIENVSLNSEKAKKQVRFQKVDQPKKADTRPETKTQ